MIEMEGNAKMNRSHGHDQRNDTAGGKHGQTGIHKRRQHDHASHSRQDRHIGHRVATTEKIQSRDDRGPEHQYRAVHVHIADCKTLVLAPLHTAPVNDHCQN